jgi:hypothetical protein
MQIYKQILLINQRANICRHWCVYMKRTCVFNDTLTFIDDTSLYILVWRETDLKRSFFVHAIFESAWYTHVTTQWRQPC